MQPNRREILTGQGFVRAMQDAAARTDDSWIAAPPTAGPNVRLETRAMACAWSVLLNPGPAPELAVASEALELVHRLEDQLTIFRDHSVISQINRQPLGELLSIEAAVFELLARSRQLSQDTGGAFDSGSGGLIDLWRMCRNAGRIPTESDLSEMLAGSGMRNLQLDEQASAVSRSDARLKLDLGAIGKGYAVDRIVAELRNGGLNSFLIHGGFSSVYAQGEHAGHAGWPVGLRNPLFTAERLGTVLLQNRGLSTSGSNVQYFRYEGKRYGHLLDPRTGWPAEKLLSVTVLAPTAAEADALSTAFYVLGLEESLAYCQSHPEISALFLPLESSRQLAPVVRNFPPNTLFLQAEQIREME